MIRRRFLIFIEAFIVVRAWLAGRIRCFYLQRCLKVLQFKWENWMKKKLLFYFIFCWKKKFLNFFLNSFLSFPHGKFLHSLMSWISSLRLTWRKGKPNLSQKELECHIYIIKIIIISSAFCTFLFSLFPAVFHPVSMLLPKDFPNSELPLAPIKS